MPFILITILFLLSIFSYYLPYFLFVMSNLPEIMTQSSLVPITLSLILLGFTIKNSHRVLENNVYLHINQTYQTIALFIWFVFRFQVAKGTKKALIDTHNFLSLAKSPLRKSTEKQISWARMTGSFFINQRIEFLAVLTTIIWW